ncbi:MAG: aminoglycoside phosphotransferase family protein [Bacteroidales bacterium]|nr:aminoglycoside phosphotransferase family protein [Bacteroidales bacterium]
MNQLFQIINHFSITGNITDIKPFGSGHIHETYRVVTETDTADDYVLQQINTNVFRDPEAVMHNIGLVTEHIGKKLKASGMSDAGRRVLTPVKLRDGQIMYRDHANKVWRCFVFITNPKTYDRAVSDEQVYEGGKAYGNFLWMLSDLPASNIRETIPGFHDLDLRLNQFEDACRTGLKERITETRHEIELLSTRKDEMRTILQLGKSGRIPVRIVHHDTKINNVLFDINGRGLCVIDLDTVMPGFVHDDFGDSIRTFTNTGEEDDANLDNISMNITYFEAFARGFLEQAGSMLNQVEKDYLALSARVMTYMQSLRFLTDYLNGDIYYRIHHPNHNLQRTRAQIKLMKCMEVSFDKMQRIITSLG